MTVKEFHARWTELGLAETATLLPVNATITPRTLAEIRPTLALPKARDENSTLPRISLDTSAVREGDVAARPGADLTIKKQLGEGGMGRVFLVRQHSLARDVALKTLKDNVSLGAKDALLEEARITGALDHPGVIPVHALGLDDNGQPLLVMKRVEGVEWRTLLEEPDHALWAQRDARGLEGNLMILMRVCETVDFSHSRGMLHLDIKPENVMVGGFGEVYLVDWGIAAPLTQGAAKERTLVGTPAYMAPEMVLGAPLDQRTDVYLLGATLHEILTARPRHPGSELHAVLLHAAMSEPVSYADDIPAELAVLANRATHVDPGMRPASAAELREALQDYLRLRGAHALSDAALERMTELERALERPDVELSEAYRLVTEARFGFAQSLREEPELAGAKRGADRAVRSLIEIELRQEHADTARALLSELAAPDAELLARIEAVEKRAGHERRETQRLRAMERDLDPGVSATARTWALGMLVALLFGVIATVQLTGGIGNIDTRTAVVISAVIALVSTSALVALRRQLLTNAFNKRLAILLMVVVYLSLGNRMLGHVTHASVHTIVVLDLTLVLSVLAGGALLLPSLWWSFAWILLAHVAARVFPEHALPLFSFAMVTNAVLLVGLFWRAKRARDPAGEP